MRHRALVVQRTVHKKGPHVPWVPGNAASAGERECLPVLHMGNFVDGAADRLTYCPNFRSIPSPRLVWLHQARDFFGLVPTRLGGRSANVTGKSRLPRGSNPHV